MTHNEMLKEAFARIKEIKGVDLFAQGWTLAYNRTVSSFGICSYNRKKIYISKTLNSARSEKEIFNTILHEAAHAALPGHNHDLVWKNLFMRIGGDGKQCSEATPDVREAVEQKIRYHMVDTTTGRVLKKYFRRPRVDTRNMYVIGRRSETIGKIAIVEV